VLPDFISRQLTEEQIQFLAEAVKQHKANIGPGNKAGSVLAGEVTKALGWSLTFKEQRELLRQLAAKKLIDDSRTDKQLGGLEFRIERDTLRYYP
jgi:hypothetical protein